MRRVILRWTIALALFALPAITANACPRCRDAVRNQSKGSLADGFSYSIYMMIGVPVAMAASGTFAVVRAARKGLLPEL
ncbi:MAG: hypothetical protein U0800_02160 [Isosphaeraceae bacterium]